jgi:hypothetical protein
MPMGLSRSMVMWIAATGWLGGGGCASRGGDVDVASRAAKSDPTLAVAAAMIEEGRQTFRHDTFGDEAFWGDTLKLHQAIAG